MEKPKHGISVDGSCLGNPGYGRYRGVDIATGKELFMLDFKMTTNNLMEFFAICHALKYRKDNGLNLEIYSDSETAIKWVKNKDVSTTLVRNADTELSYIMLQKSLMWLVNNIKNQLPISKWRTDLWGECPADFGMKNKSSKPAVSTDPGPQTNETMVSKADLAKFIQKEWTREMPDITTLARLAETFKINIEHE